MQKWTCQSQRKTIDCLLGTKGLGRNWKVPALNYRELLLGVSGLSEKQQLTGALSSSWLAHAKT